MEQVIFGGYSNLLSTSTTEYNTLASGYLWTASIGRHNKVISTDGVLKNLYMKLTAAPGAGKQYEFTVMLNGVATDLSVTVTDSDTTGNNTSDELVVTGGDKVELRCTPTGTPASTSATWSVMFSGDISAESLILGGGDGANVSNETRYAQISGGIGNWSTTEVDHTQIIPTSGTIKNFYVELQNSPDPGLSDGYRFTVRIGVASPASGLVVEITGDDVADSDLVNTISVSAGDRITVMCEPIGTPANTARVFMGATFLADIDGESIVLGGSGRDITTGTTVYHHPSPWTNNTWSATESGRVQLGQLCVITKLYVDLSAAPGSGGDQYTLTIRTGGAGSNVTVVITDAATTGNSSTLADSVADGELVSIQSVPAVTPATVNAYWGFVVYIPPPITYTADTVIMAIRTKTYTADIAVKAFDKTKTYTADVAIEDEDKAKTYTVDVVIEKTGTETYTADTLIKSVDNAKTYTTDVILITIEYRYFTVHLPQTTQTITLPQTTQTVHLRGNPS